MTVGTSQGSEDRCCG